MNALDYLKATGVAIVVIVFTIAASFPMVAFYAYFIEPGHDQEFYVEAAQWIAPWSSYILGPITFFALNYWLAKKNPARNALLFSIMTLVAYLVIDLSMVLAMNGDLGLFLSFWFAFTVAVKLAAAIVGAHLGNNAAKATVQ